MSRSAAHVHLEVRSSIKQVLHIGRHQWLLLNGKVSAVLAEEVYFADQSFSRSGMAAINEFNPQVPHVRVPLDEWDYYVASSGMRGLRPLLGKPQEEEPT